MFFGGDPFGGGMGGMPQQRKPVDNKGLYDLLGVDQKATTREITMAFRKKSLKLHPDKTRNIPDEKERAEKDDLYKKMSNAKDILCDDEKRELYDQGGLEAVEQGHAGGHGDIFDMLSGRGRRGGGGGKKKAKDIDNSIRIHLSDAMKGLTKKYKVTRSVVDKSKSVQDCPACGGSGQRMVRQGPMIMQQTCGRCKGTGKIFAMLTESETVEVHIPPGCADGHKIRLNEKGDQPRPDVIPADLVYHITVEEHPDFERQGDDLIIQRDISLVEALTGIEMDVATLDGRNLIIRTNPGEIIPAPPVNAISYDDDGSLEKFANTTCDGENLAQAPDAAKMPIKKLVALAKQKGIDFTAIELDAGGDVYFKQGDPKELHESKEPKAGHTVYIVSAPKQDMQKSVADEGMPTAGNPFEKGHLIIKFDLKMPTSLSAEAIETLKRVLPGPIHKSRNAKRLADGSDKTNFSLGDAVEIVGLTSAAGQKLNGKTGTVRGIDKKDKERLSIMLETGESKSIKRSNIKLGEIYEHTMVEVDARERLEISKKLEANATEEDDRGGGGMGGQEGVQCQQS